MARPTALLITRVAHGLRHVDVADAAGLSPGRLSRIESGRLRPSAGEQAAILHAIGHNAEQVVAVAESFVELCRAARRCST